jgi:DNA-binding NarL/FixJ family response regulator
VSPGLRVAIADDHALFVQGLCSLLTLDPDVTVVAEIARADDIVPMLTRVACDVLLLDIQLDRNVLREVATFAAYASVVLLTANERSADARRAFRAGAKAVVFKRSAVGTLKEALRAVAVGQVWIPPSLQAEVARELRHGRGNCELTEREREVTRYVAAGRRNAEVAAVLGISEETVKKHLSNVFQKLEVRDRVELTLTAIALDIVSASDRHA